MTRNYDEINELRKQNRNIVLFLDKVRSHPNVHKIVLPPKTTSYSQPLYQEIFHNFKMIGSMIYNQQTMII